MSEASKIARDSAYVFGARAFTMIASLIMGITLARLLGKDMYGLVSWAVFLEGILFIFADLGAQEAGARRISERRANGLDVSGTVVSATAIKLVGGLLLTAILVIFSSTIALNLNQHPQAIISVYACAGLLLLDAVSTAMYSSLYGFREMTITSYAEVVQSASKTGLAVILVVMGYGLKGALIGLVAGSAILLVFYVYSFKKTVLPELKHIRIDAGEMRHILSYGFFIGLSWTIFKVYTSFDQFYIGAKLTMGDYVCYSIAMSLALLLFYGIFAVRRVLFASFTMSVSTNSHGMVKDMFAISFKYIAALAIPAGVGLAMLSPEMISAIYGYQYIAAAAVLMPLAIMGIFKTCEIPSSALIDGGGNARVGTFVSAITAIANVVLNLLLIPGNDIMGAAIACLISLGGCSILYHYFAMRFYGVKLPIKDIALLSCAALVMAVTVQALKFYMYAGNAIKLQSSVFSLEVLAVCIPAAIIVYSMTLLMLGIISHDDGDKIKRAAGTGLLSKPVSILLFVSEKLRIFPISKPRVFFKARI